MKESIIKTAELAIVQALSASLSDVKQGRLKGLLDKMYNESDMLIRRQPKLSRVEFWEINRQIEKFKELSQWGKKDKHILTYVNSILLIIEPKQYKKLNSILVDIADYILRKKTVQMGVFWTAPEIEQKWRQCFN